VTVSSLLGLLLQRQIVEANTDKLGPTLMAGAPQIESQNERYGKRKSTRSREIKILLQSIAT
jgi:hypothetical protein